MRLPPHAARSWPTTSYFQAEPGLQLVLKVQRNFEEMKWQPVTVLSCGTSSYGAVMLKLLYWAAQSVSI